MGEKTNYGTFWIKKYVKRNLNKIILLQMNFKLTCKKKKSYFFKKYAKDGFCYGYCRSNIANFLVVFYKCTATTAGFESSTPGSICSQQHFKSTCYHLRKNLVMLVMSQVYRGTFLYSLSVWEIGKNISFIFSSNFDVCKFSHNRGTEKERNPWSSGREFESHHWILDGHFFT